MFRRIKESYEAKIAATISGQYSLDQTNPLGFRFSVDTEEGRGKYTAYQYSFTLLSPTLRKPWFSLNSSSKYKRLNSFDVNFDYENTRNWDLDLA
ncbi:MAG TPA: hypothetical protein VMZ27_13980, partial [Candidatus Saccharimonadales bacterium]|nr:hypothetical protein [Candidatus Saccharimonadales bacterium]